MRISKSGEADGFPDMRIVKSGKLTVSLTCDRQVRKLTVPDMRIVKFREADGFPDMQSASREVTVSLHAISKSGKLRFPDCESQVGKLTVSLTCESASPEADGFPECESAVRKLTVS